MSASLLLMIAGILLVETLVASFASFFLKKSSGSENKIDIIKSPYFYLGGVLYVISSCLSIVLLQFLPYAVVLPLGSVTYVWTMLISRWLLKERITKRKLAGVGLIIVGVILLAAGQI